MPPADVAKELMLAILEKQGQYLQSNTFEHKQVAQKVAEMYRIVYQGITSGDPPKP